MADDEGGRAGCTLARTLDGMRAADVWSITISHRPRCQSSPSRCTSGGRPGRAGWGARRWRDEGNDRRVSPASLMGPRVRQCDGTASWCQRRRRDDRGEGAGWSRSVSVVMAGRCRCRWTLPSRTSSWADCSRSIADWASTVEAATARFGEFAEHWGDRYPAMTPPGNGPGTTSCRCSRSRSSSARSSTPRT